MSLRWILAGVHVHRSCQDMRTSFAADRTQRGFEPPRLLPDSNLSCEPAGFRVNPLGAASRGLFDLPGDITLGSLRFLAGDGDTVLPHLLMCELLCFHFLDVPPSDRRGEDARGRIRVGTRRAPAA
jgi:hypothetical protein